MIIVFLQAADHRLTSPLPFAPLGTTPAVSPENGYPQRMPPMPGHQPPCMQHPRLPQIAQSYN